MGMLVIQPWTSSLVQLYTSFFFFFFFFLSTTTTTAFVAVAPGAGVLLADHQHHHHHHQQALAALFLHNNHKPYYYCPPPLLPRTGRTRLHQNSVLGQWWKEQESLWFVSSSSPSSRTSSSNADHRGITTSTTAAAGGGGGAAAAALRLGSCCWPGTTTTTTTTTQRPGNFAGSLWTTGQKRTSRPRGVVVDHHDCYVSSSQQEQLRSPHYTKSTASIRWPTSLAEDSLELGTFESPSEEEEDDDDEHASTNALPAAPQPVVPHQQGQWPPDNTTRPSSSSSSSSSAMANETKQPLISIGADKGEPETSTTTGGSITIGIASRRNNGTTTATTTTAKSKTVTFSPASPVTTTTTTATARNKQSALQLTLPNKLHRSDVLTVADLEAILQSNGLLTASSSTTTNSISAKQQSVSSSLSSSSSFLNDRVAFPQPSVVSEQAVRYGSTVAASVLGIIIGASVLTNLWLIGGLVGGCYGYMVVQQQQPVAVGTINNKNNKDEIDNDSPTNPVASLVTFLGTRLARWALWWHDAIVSVLFLFKTGQLSYQYYKAYAAMDRAWEVQSKIDAWNAKFVEGKKAFDAWERQNEIGRKTLALLRTVTFVEEKQRRRYRHRLVKVGQRAWKEMQAYDHVVLAVASALAAGVCWSVLSPPVVMILALALGAVWPTWLSEWIRLLRQSRLLSTITIRSAAASSTQKINQQQRQRNMSRSMSMLRRRPTEDVHDRPRDLTFGWFGQQFRPSPPPQRLARRSNNYYHSATTTRRKGHNNYYNNNNRAAGGQQPMWSWPWQQRPYVRPPPPRWKFWLR